MPTTGCALAENVTKKRLEITTISYEFVPTYAVLLCFPRRSSVRPHNRLTRFRLISKKSDYSTTKPRLKTRRHIKLLDVINNDTNFL